MRPFLSNGEEGRQVYDAVIAGDIDAVETLIRVIAGDIDAVETLIRANPKLLETHRVLATGERPSNGNTGGLLTFAIARCDARMVGALLELGADPDGVPPGNALTYAALADDPLMATMLLQAGANPDAAAPNRATPLREVLYYERADAVTLLARAGADVNRADSGGGTPLEAAISFGDYRSAEALMQAGANPWLLGNKGSLPAAMLQEQASDSAQELIRERLLTIAREKAPIWPPPQQSEIIRQFANGAWPTPDMERAGMVATAQALASIRQVASRAR